MQPEHTSGLTKGRDMDEKYSSPEWLRELARGRALENGLNSEESATYADTVFEIARNEDER